MNKLTPLEKRLLVTTESRDELLRTYFELKSELRVAAKNGSGTRSAEVVEFAQRLLEIVDACDWLEKE